MTSQTFKLGVTFHSFAAEYLSYTWSFEDMMEKAAALGGGVEIVGPSHVRGFPKVTPEFERIFKSSVERFSLTPTCYGSYADPFMLPDRNLTPDEIYEYTLPQIEGAALLGFPVLRLQAFHSVAASKLVAAAEKAGVKLGYELHVPMMINSDVTKRLIEQIELINSPYLGLIPDAGIFARAISEEMLSRGRKLGLSDTQLAEIVGFWDQKLELPTVLEKLGAWKVSQEIIGWAALVWDHFGFSLPEELDTIAPHIIHFHGKFYDIVDGDEPYVRYEGIVHALQRMNYTGWMNSELEGSLRSPGSKSSFELVKEQQEMIRRYAASYSGS